MGNLIFEVGQQVRWTRVALGTDKLNAVGTIVSIKAAPQQFAMYEVQFVFGRVMLYGTQIELCDDVRKKRDMGSEAGPGAFVVP